MLLGSIKLQTRNFDYLRKTTVQGMGNQLMNCWSDQRSPSRAQNLKTTQPLAIALGCLFIVFT